MEFYPAKSMFGAVDKLWISARYFSPIFSHLMNSWCAGIMPALPIGGIPDEFLIELIV